MRLMEKDVYHRKSFMQEAGSPKEQELQSEAASQQNEMHLQPRFNTIQNTIMRNISQQDF